MAEGEWTFPRGFEKSILNFFKFYKGYRKLQNYEPTLDDVLKQASQNTEYEIRAFFNKQGEASPPVRSCFESVISLYKLTKSEDKAAAYIQSVIDRDAQFGEENIVIDSASTPAVFPQGRTRSTSRVSEFDSPQKHPAARLADTEAEEDIEEIVIASDTDSDTEIEKEAVAKTDSVKEDYSHISSDIIAENLASVVVTVPPEPKMSDYTPSAGLILEYCDQNMIMGQVNRIPADYESIELCFDAHFNQTNGLPADYPKGFGVYVRQGEKNAAKKMASQVVTNLKVALNYRTHLENANLDVDADVDVSNMTQSDLEDFQEVQSNLTHMRHAITNLNKLKGRLAKTLKASSIPGYNRFFNRALKEIEVIDTTADVWCQLRDTGSGSAGNNTSVTNLSTSLGGIHLGGNRGPNNPNVTSVPSTFNLKMGTAKLPEVKLKKFSGRISDFLRWRSDFQKYVLRFYSEKYIDEYQLNTYLWESLPKTLQDDMNNMPWDYDGFLKMWKELDRKFGSELTQVLTWRKMLQNMKPPSTDIESLSQFRLSVTNAVNGLLLAGQTVIKEGDTWLAYLLPKLPPPLMTSWITYKNLSKTADPQNWKRKPVFSHFIDWLESHDDEMRTVDAYKALSSGSKSTKKGGKGKKRKVDDTVHTYSTSVGEPQKSDVSVKKKKGDKNAKPTNADGQKAKAKCCFCNSLSHKPAHCQKDLASDTGPWEQVYAGNWCYSCLRSTTHRPNQCENKRNSRRCGVKEPDGKRCEHWHHPRLHNSKYLTVRAWKEKQK